MIMKLWYLEESAGFHSHTERIDFPLAQLLDQWCILSGIQKRDQRRVLTQQIHLGIHWLANFEQNISLVGGTGIRHNTRAGCCIFCVTEFRLKTGALFDLYVETVLHQCRSDGRRNGHTTKMMRV